MSGTPEEIIELLGLRPLDKEGGYYRETYRSKEMIAKNALPGRYAADKPFCTAIYYLITPGARSAMHRIPSDEIFHFLSGDPVTMLQLFPDGTGATFTLGSDIKAGHIPQIVVPAGTWQGSFLNRGGVSALFSVTVAPGFDFSDYEHGSRRELEAGYPGFRELVAKLT